MVDFAFPKIPVFASAVVQALSQNNNPKYDLRSELCSSPGPWSKKGANFQERVRDEIILHNKFGINLFIWIDDENIIFLKR